MKNWSAFLVILTSIVYWSVATTYTPTHVTAATQVARNEVVMSAHIPYIIQFTSVQVCVEKWRIPITLDQQHYNIFLCDSYFINPRRLKIINFFFNSIKRKSVSKFVFNVIKHFIALHPIKCIIGSVDSTVLSYNIGGIRICYRWKLIKS